MVKSFTKYHLGLDLGTNSIGWAAVRLNYDGAPCGLLDMGVRIFPDGRDEGGEASNAAGRRQERGQRRRRDRYLSRRTRLMQMLVDSGLMPEDAAGQQRLENFDPYELRARALDKPLRPYELGRTLFHLDQRRGFKSNRKASGDEQEDGQVRTDVNKLRRRLEQSGTRTLGEFLAKRLNSGETVRARPEEGLRADRAMYEAEFDAIRAAQEQYHNLSGVQWAELRRIIFLQLPLRPVVPGWCQFEFENSERRAARALPVFQEFRMLQEMNNLKIQEGSAPERPLNVGERQRMLQRLREGKDINLDKPTAALKLPPGAKFNLARGARTTIKGDETTAKLASTGKPARGNKPAQPALFGGRWFALSLDERNEIVRFLLDTEEPEHVREKAVAEWGLSEEQADAVANVSLAPGYGSLSEKAIRKILPYLEQGKVFSDAVRDAGYEHHSDFRNAEVHDQLPYYGQVLPRDAVGADPAKDPELDGEAARYGRIANPTVHIGLGQLRRVVNRLTEAYGKPEEIVVELARELKSNRAQKLEFQRQQRDGAARNKKFREDMESAEIEVTPDALRKLRLWEEQGPPQNRVCPYTGQQISFAMVMSAQTEVDHILPFSRTLDNSLSNMVVCMADANRVKGNHTPYEAFGDECLQHVASFPANKRWRFQADAMERFEGERGFLDRQLNETQYLSRTARTYLAYLYDEQGEHRQRVRVIPGRMTALLRRGWGLEGMLNETADDAPPRKTRDDQRHHAVDAFVVANTTPGLLQRFAQAAGSNYDRERNLAAVAKDVLPWQGFDRSEVQASLDKMVVSYKPDHGSPGVKGQTTGKLHEATAYGLIEPVDESERRYKVVLRKDLSKFTAKDLDKVPDQTLQDALRRLWGEADGKTAEFAERAAGEGVPMNGRRQRVRRVRLYSEERVIPIKDASGKPYKGYKPGGNEFADVWRMPDGSWRTVVVPTFDANQPGFDPNDFRPHPNAKRLMRLQIDDMGALGMGANRHIVRVRKITNAKTGVLVFLDDHNETDVAGRVSRKEMKESKYSARQLKTQGFRKVRVDEIGRVFDRGPFKS